MSRLPLVLLVLALPAFAQEADAGAPPSPTGVDEAQELLNAGKATEAVQRLDVVLAQSPDDPRALALRCQARAALGKDDETVRDCDLAANAAPSDVKVRQLLATAQERLGRPSEALETYRAVLNTPEATGEQAAEARVAFDRLDLQLHAGRHFSYLWDADVPALGTSQPQLWVNPHWGRVDQYTAVDLRAGMLQSVSRVAAVGFFVDASPKSIGTEENATIDARGTLAWHNAARFFDKRLGLGDHVEVSVGPNGMLLLGLLMVDAQLGPVRLDMNGDVSWEHHWTDAAAPNLRSQQLFGFMYGLNNGFSFGVEAMNRISWTNGTFDGMAFYFGPGLSYRGRRVWFTLAMLPQVAAKKSASNTTGDPLELTDNERYSLKLIIGTVAP
jgi:hypothetical protein